MKKCWSGEGEGHVPCTPHRSANVQDTTFVLPYLVFQYNGSKTVVPVLQILVWSHGGPRRWRFWRLHRCSHKHSCKCSHKHSHHLAHSHYLPANVNHHILNYIICCQINRQQSFVPLTLKLMLASGTVIVMSQVMSKLQHYCFWQIFSLFFFYTATCYSLATVQLNEAVFSYIYTFYTYTPQTCVMVSFWFINL